MRTRISWNRTPRTGILGIFGIVVALAAVSARAATFVVTRTDDPPPDGCIPVDCSLREAVLDANGNGTADTITLPAGIYVLQILDPAAPEGATGDLDITEELTIQGAGARVTAVDAAGIDRVFQINPSATNVEMADLTIRNGLLSGGSGGGILHLATTLTLTRCTVTDNTAFGRGGGLHSAGSVTIVDSTFHSNGSANGGGAISHSGPGQLILVNSTLAGNATAASGGGLLTQGPGTAALYNVTVSGNVADALEDGFGDGGGIWAALLGVVELTHTVIAGNSDPGGEAPDCGVLGNGVLHSGGHNLVQDPTACILVGDLTGNLTGDDPLLGPLSDNGGQTDTVALGLGSPAIDAGLASGCLDAAGAPLTADQTGLLRPRDGDGDGTAICDLGAVESPIEPLIFSDGFEAGDTSGWSASTS